MKKADEKRPIELGKHIVETGATVRQTAQVFGISKSTVHKDVAERLKTLDKRLFKRVRKVLDKNKQERTYRGGEATKQMYARLKEENAKKKKQIKNKVNNTKTNKANKIKEATVKLTETNIPLNQFNTFVKSEKPSNKRTKNSEVKTKNKGVKTKSNTKGKQQKKSTNTKKGNK